MKNEDVKIIDQPTTGWRFKLGIVLFGLSIFLPVVGIPLLAICNLSAGVTATVSAGLLMGSEVMGVVAIAVMGKSGFAVIKNRVFKFLKQYGPPRKVGRRRYTVGLVMFNIPILFGVISVYMQEFIPYLHNNPISFALGGDLLFVASFFVLGGDFWDKIRSLFIFDAKVNFSQSCQIEKK